MKVVAAVFADFAESFLGGPSHLLTELAGQPILRRTLTRLLRTSGAEKCCLCVRPRDQQVAEHVVREWGFAETIDVLPKDPGTRPRRELVRSARKWKLDAWRGSPLGTTWFDEFVEPLAAAHVLDHYACQSVFCLDGHMPVLDPQITTAMLVQQREYEAEGRVGFTQAPPGLAGVLLDRETVRELLEQDLPLGLVFTYRPEMPHGDLINRPGCLQVDPHVAQRPARLTGDTRRSRELLSDALRELGEDASAIQLCRWLAAPGRDTAGPLPLEIELELTTDNPLPETTLRPRGNLVPTRRLADLDALGRLAAELAEYDDRTVVLGGHGDPLAHPAFAEVCRRLRLAGICGISVVTPLVELSDANLGALLESRVDLVQVRLDANSAEAYRRVHQADRFDQVLANVQRIDRARQERRSPQPIVAPSLTRCAATLDEMEPFYDRWIHATGCAVIEGYNEFCGALPSDSLLATEPPTRGPCRRVPDRLMLLADGSAALCHQDFRGTECLGRWDREPVAALWKSDRRARLSQAHAEANLAAWPLCGACREWFRP